MAIDLPLMPVPYPDAKPVYQLRSLLAPGVQEIGYGACWAQATENLVTISIRVNPSQVVTDDGNIFIGLPAEFRPMANTPDVAQQQVFMMTDGRIWYRTTAGSLRDKTEFNAVFIVARRAS